MELTNRLVNQVTVFEHQGWYIFVDDDVFAAAIDMLSRSVDEAVKDQVPMSDRFQMKTQKLKRYNTVQMSYRSVGCIYCHTGDNPVIGSLCEVVDYFTSAVNKNVNHTSLFVDGTIVEHFKPVTSIAPMTDGTFAITVSELGFKQVDGCLSVEVTIGKETTKTTSVADLLSNGTHDFDQYPVYVNTKSLYIYRNLCYNTNPHPGVPIPSR